MYSSGTSEEKWMSIWERIPEEFPKEYKEFKPKFLSVKNRFFIIVSDGFPGESQLIRKNSRDVSGISYDWYSKKSQRDSLKNYWWKSGKNNNKIFQKFREHVRTSFRINEVFWGTWIFLFRIFREDSCKHFYKHEIHQEILLRPLSKFACSTFYVFA